MSKASTKPPTPTSIPPGTIFRLAQHLGDLPDSVKLRNLEWGILFAVTGQHTVAQIGEHFQLSSNERDQAFARLEADGFLVEREVTYSEYLRAMATVRDDEPKTLARFLRSGASLGAGASRPALPAPKEPTEDPPANPPPQAPKPSNPPEGPSTRELQPIRPQDAEPAAPRIDPKDFDQAPDDTTRAIPTASLAAMFQPLASPPDEDSNPQALAPSSKEAMPMNRRLSLKALMQFILDRAADLTAGQLDIYRVFIRVNTRLLKRNGITTLRFQDDRLISDPELQEAIVSSVEKTLGLSCPEEVYV